MREDLNEKIKELFQNYGEIMKALSQEDFSAEELANLRGMTHSLYRLVTKRIQKPLCC